MLSRPSRGERPACSAGRRVESVRYSSQAVERSVDNRRRPSKGERQSSPQAVEKRASGIRRRRSERASGMLSSPLSVEPGILSRPPEERVPSRGECVRRRPSKGQRQVAARRAVEAAQGSAGHVQAGESVPPQAVEKGSVRHSPQAVEKESVVRHAEESVGHSPQAVQRRALHIRRRPCRESVGHAQPSAERGERPAFSAGRPAEERVRQFVLSRLSRGASGIRRRPSRGERPAYAAGRQKEQRQVYARRPSRRERQTFGAGSSEESAGHAESSAVR